MRQIFHKEQQKFKILWHKYHRKYKIPYSHDEADLFFNSLVEIFKKGW